MHPHLPDDFSDEHARAILARAIELDARGPLTTTAQLRAIASELSVSPRALDAALAEHATIGAASPSAPAHAARALARRIASLGIPVGLVAGGLVTSGSGMGLMGLEAVARVVSGALAMTESAAGSLGSFQRKNGVLWGSALVATVASATLLGPGAERTPLLIAAGWCVRSFVVSAVLGSATMLAAQRARRGGAGGPTASGSDGPRVWVGQPLAAVRRMATRLIGVWRVAGAVAALSV